MSLTTVSTSTTGEQEHLVSWGSASVNINASVRLGNMSAVYSISDEGPKLTRLLTMRALPATLSCFPAVMTSNFWPALPSQAPTVIGMRFSRKSPELASTLRHWPSEVYDKRGEE